jgi:DNA modification methylase
MTCRIEVGDALGVLRGMPAESVHCCVTSPPYWGLRDYGTDCQLGLEKTPEEYVARMVEVFREVRRVLRDDGTLWLNLGDSYRKNPARRFGKRPQDAPPPAGSGIKPKDLVGIPWRVAFALQADGWYLRSDIIWHKPNPMPESCTDRPTKAHEYVFLLSKRARYFYDAETRTR